MDKYIHIHVYINNRKNTVRREKILQKFLVITNNTSLLRVRKPRHVFTFKTEIDFAYYTQCPILVLTHWWQRANEGCIIDSPKILGGRHVRSLMLSVDCPRHTSTIHSCGDYLRAHAIHTLDGVLQYLKHSWPRPPLSTKCRGPRGEGGYFRAYIHKLCTYAFQFRTTRLCKPRFSIEKGDKKKHVPRGGEPPQCTRAHSIPEPSGRVSFQHSIKLPLHEKIFSRSTWP